MSSRTAQGGALLWSGPTHVREAEERRQDLICDEEGGRREVEKAEEQEEVLRTTLGVVLEAGLGLDSQEGPVAALRCSCSGRGQPGDQALTVSLSFLLPVRKELQAEATVSENLEAPGSKVVSASLAA